MDEARLKDFVHILDSVDLDTFESRKIGKELVLALREAWREREIMKIEVSEGMAGVVSLATEYRERADRAESERDIASERAHVARADFERAEYDANRFYERAERAEAEVERLQHELNTLNSGDVPEHPIIREGLIQELEAALEVAKDMYDLARRLDDDPYFGERRSARERFEKARKILSACK